MDRLILDVLVPNNAAFEFSLYDILWIAFLFIYSLIVGSALPLSLMPALSAL